jgi:tetratricopeptide (TPR) repeat protein
MQGAAGAIIIVTLAPVDPAIVNNLFESTQASEGPSASAQKPEPPQLFIKLIALALIGGYAGSSLLESSASQYAKRVTEVEDKTNALEEGRKQVEDKINALEEDTRRIEEQSKLNLDAVRVAEQILRGVMLPASEIEEFKQTLQDISSQVRFEIAYRADENRRQNWDKNKETLERSLVIFQALITTEDAKTCHWWYASLGYCLKDKHDPIYAEALKCLNKAIEIRGPETRSGAYEFNRAICNIQLSDRLLDKVSEQIRYQQIKKDLDTAVTFPRFKDIIENDSTIQAWLRQTDLLEREVRRHVA